MSRTLTIFAPLLLAASLPSHWTLGMAKPIVAGAALELVATTDGDEPLTARIVTDKADARLTAITVSQDGRELRLPGSAYAGLTGASRAWLEERGALSTLLVEGKDSAGRYHLALEFHPEQLWLRRLSREGVSRDSFTFYDRENIEPGAEQMRHFEGRGLRAPRGSD